MPIPLLLVGLMLGLASCSGDVRLLEAPLQMQPAFRKTNVPTDVVTQTAVVSSTSTIPAVAAEGTPAPFIAKESEFTSEHFSLVGELQLPSEDGRHPVIIMVHGDGGIDRTDLGIYLPIKERFLCTGFAVFSWDKLGTGD